MASRHSQTQGGVPLFRPIEHPILRGCSTSDAVRFLEKRREYEFEVQEKNKQPGVSMTPIPYMGSISRSLADALIRARKFGTEVDDYTKLTDSAVETYIRELAGKSPQAPDSKYLECLVHKVKMKNYQEEPDGEARALDLFHRYCRALEQGGCSAYLNSPENLEHISKQLVSLVTPSAVQRKLFSDIAANKKYKREGLHVLMDLIVQRVREYDVYNADSIVSKRSREEYPEDFPADRESKRPRGLKSKQRAPNNKRTAPQGQRFKEKVRADETPLCLNSKACPGERHLIRDCPKSSDSEKRSLLSDYRKSRKTDKASSKGRVSAAVDASAYHQTTTMDGATASAIDGVAEVNFVASFENGAHHTILKADTGSDINLLMEKDVERIKMAGVPIEYVDLRESSETYDGIVSGHTFKVNKTIKLDFSLEVRHTSHLHFRNVVFRVAPDGTVSENILGRHTLHHAGLDVSTILEAASHNGPINVEDINDDDAVAPPSASKVASLLRQLEIDHNSGSNDATAGPLTDEDDFLLEIGTDTPEEIQAALEEMIERSTRSLPPEEAQRLRDLVHEFQDIFRVRLGRDAPARVDPMTVDLRPNARPVRAKVRSYSTEKRVFLNAYIANLVEFGYLKPNPTAAWASAPNLVPKPGPKRYRMTVDLRPINAATIPYVWPMPHIDSEASDFAGSKAFATIDYCSGYWQLPLADEAQALHSIITPTGVYSPTRTLQGATNSAANFQAKVEPLYASLRSSLKAWLDDFILHTASFPELLIVLREFFAITRAHGLLLSATKTTLYSREIRWCGRLIDSEGVRLDPAQFELLQNLAVPRTGGELSQFVHAVTWLSHSIPDFAARISPLRALLERVYSSVGSRLRRKIANVPLRASLSWGPDHAAAYSDLQTQLRASVKLAHVDPSQVICVHTDASSARWAGIVTQVSHSDLDLPVKDQRHYPLAFLGGGFTPRESSWSTYEQEAFAVTAVFKRIPYILEPASRVLVFTDHRNLLFAFSPLSFKPDLGRHVIHKVQRWAQYLSRFSYEIRHVSGDVNHFADMLTRWAVGYRGNPEANTSTPRGAVSLIVNSSVTLELQSPWPRMEDIIAEQRRFESSFSLEVSEGHQPENGLWQTKEGQVWVPDDADRLKIRLLVIAHCGDAGHRGRKATTAMLTQAYWWINVKDDVTEFCKKCLLCLCTLGGEREPRPLGSAVHGEKPGQVIHFDYLFLCPASSGDRYVLIVRDDLSSYTWISATTSPTAEHAADVLFRWFTTFRVPEICVSDGGSHFRNAIFKELADKYRFRHHVTTAYTPWANGTAERAGREILRAFRVLVSDLKISLNEWPSLVLSVQSVLNNSPLERLGLKTPTEIFTGQTPSTRVAMTLPHGIERRNLSSSDSVQAAQRLSITSVVSALEELHKSTHELAQATRERQRRYRDRGASVPNFESGDFVLVASRRRGHKLGLRWTGPYRVIECSAHHVYEVENIMSGKKETIHATRMRFYNDASLEITPELQAHVLNSDDTLFIVDTFLDLQRADQDESFLLLTRWKGFTSDYDSWEPFSNMARDVPALLKRWLLQQPVTEDVRAALAALPP